MAIVENNIVKMEWEKSEWLQTKSGTFIFAAKTYSGTNGDVSVLSVSDVEEFIKTNGNAAIQR